MSLGEKDLGLVDLAHAVELQPDLAEAWLALAIAYARFEAVEGMTDALEECVRLNPNSALAHLIRGIYLAISDSRKAKMFIWCLPVGIS